MTYSNVTSWALCILILLIMLQGCGKSSGEFDPLVLTRGILFGSVLTGDNSNEKTLSLPVEISFSIVVERGQADGGRENLVTKVELNPGDKSGWLDVTAEYLSQPINNLIPHTYTENGVYNPQARATFWDGEVVYSITKIIDLQLAEE